MSKALAVQSARLAGGNAGSKRFTMCAAGVAAPSPAVCRPSRGGAGAFSSTASSVSGSGGRRALHAVGGNGASVAPAPAAAAAPAGYGGQEEGWYILFILFS